MIPAAAPITAPFPLPTWLPWACLGTGIVVLLIAAAHAWRVRRRARLPFPAAGPLVEPKVPAAALNPTGALPALAADMDELAQRLAARLDAKAERLELLIAQADDRIDQLTRLERAAGLPPVSRAGSNFDRHPHAPANTHAAHHHDPDDDAPDPITRQIYQLADEGLPPVEIARRLAQHTGKIELILALRNA